MQRTCYRIGQIVKILSIYRLHIISYLHRFGCNIKIKQQSLNEDASFPDNLSKYNTLSSSDVKKEIFESVRKELKDEINVDFEDQVCKIDIPIITTWVFYQIPYYNACRIYRTYIPIHFRSLLDFWGKFVERIRLDGNLI